MEPRITAWDADQSMSWWAPELSADPGRHREVGEQAEAVEEEGNRSDAADRTQQNRLRGDVVDRLALACRRHARHRADREWERGHPISHHIIVFFYREPGSAEAPDLLRIATRIFLAGDDVDDLPSIVAQLYALSREYLAMGRFDPREQLSTRVEPMTSNAQYVGLGAATLDPYDIQRESYLPDERPFRAIAALNDGTRMLSVWTGGQGSVRTESTHTLDVGATRTRTWAWAGPVFLQGRSEVARTAASVIRLNEFILQNSQPDRMARSQRGDRWWRRL